MNEPRKCGNCHYFNPDGCWCEFTKNPVGTRAEFVACTCWRERYGGMRK